VRTIVKGKNFEVAAADRRYLEDKLRRLERLLDDRTEALVELSHESHRSPSTSHIVDVTLVIDGQALRSSSAGPTHKAGIDAVVDKIERRAVDFRQTSRVRKSAETVRGGRADAAGAGAAAGEADERHSRITKVKRFDIEPMFEEDAVARMEELGHEFFIFVNAENERVAVLYRRGEGGYGLIEPVLGGDYTKGGPPRRSGPH
jgi:putative sigma-54 modulation protein